MKTKFIDNSKEIQMIREWGDTTCITQQREIFSDLIDTIPDLFPKLVPKINDIIGYGFVFYIVKFDHPDLQDYFKTGIAKCLKERFNDKRIRIRKIHPNVIEQKTFDFQVVGSREFETMMKRMIPHNIELEKIGVKTEGDYFPGHTEFYTMDKWDEVINLAEQEYPNYKDIVGVKRAK